MGRALSTLFVCAALLAQDSQADIYSSENYSGKVSNLTKYDAETKEYIAQTKGNETRMGIPFKEMRKFFCDTIAKGVQRNPIATINDPQVEGCSKKHGEFSVRFPLTFTFKFESEVEEVKLGREKKAKVFRKHNDATFVFSPAKNGSATRIKLTIDSEVWDFKHKEGMKICVEYGRRNCPRIEVVAKGVDSKSFAFDGMSLEYKAYSDEEETYRVKADLSNTGWIVRYGYWDDEGNGEDFVELTGGPTTEASVVFYNKNYVEMALVPESEYSKKSSPSKQ